MAHKATVLPCLTRGIIGFAAQNLICLKSYDKQSKLPLATKHTQKSDTTLYHTLGYPSGDAEGSSLLGQADQKEFLDCSILKLKTLISFELSVAIYQAKRRNIFPFRLLFRVLHLYIVVILKRVKM